MTSDTVASGSAVGRTRAGWELFARWCAATGRTATSATDADLDRFFVDIPARGSTLRRRLAAIRSRSSGFESNRQHPHREPRGVDGAGTLMAAQPNTVRGARDRALVAALAAGTSRRGIGSLAPVDVLAAPFWTVAGSPIDAAASPLECGRCAMVLWSKVLAEVAAGRRADAAAAAAAAARDGASHAGAAQHGCLQGFGDWAFAPALFPPLDRYGWTSGTGLTSRGVYRILATMPTEQQAPEVEPTAPTGLVANGAELYDALGQAEAAADDLDDRLARLFDELTQIADAIDGRANS